MNDNCFIDTNVLVYCYTNDELAKRQQALKVANNDNAFISTQVLTELANTFYRKFNISWQMIEAVLNEINSGFNVFVNNQRTINQALRIAEKYKYSLYDSLIISSALSCNCKTLYSEDMHDGQVIEDKLIIRNPFK